jgi:hypothetical protein
MKNRWLSFVSMSLVIFAGLVTAWQVAHRDGPGAGMVPESCIALSWHKGQDLAKIHDLVPRASAYWPGVGAWWTLDLVLPEDTRIFMTDMTGITNYFKTAYYYSATYYLFPREIGVSVDRPTTLNQNGFLGETSRSDQEILAHGYDVRLDFGSDEKMFYKALHELPLRNPVNPDWFDSAFDTGIAFVLPLFTALAGMWLLRVLFSGLVGKMPLPEQLAYASGLGMMTVAALTLGIKLCGFHGYHLVYVMTGIGAIAEIWHNHKVYVTAMAGGCRRMIHHPVTLAMLLAGMLVFLIFFRLAGLQGLVDLDAAMAWLLKAKMLHLYAGSELVHWFSTPRLANAHLDFPTLVPALHAATYDSLGHVDEFVTKFWPTWMLLFLLGALASLNRGGSNRFYAPWFGLLGLLLLPATQKYVQMEGGTLPMVFFTVLGSVQCALWLMEKDRARLGLGLTLLFGAAMTKFEGSIFLVLIGSWFLLLPAARPSLKPSPRFWRVPAFCFFAALPFFCLRLQIPSVNYESSWAGHVLSHPVSILSMLADWNRLFLIQSARLFVNPGFASWSGEDGHLHWNGRWDSFSSLYNPSTLGLAWLCLLMTLAVWFAFPARRRIAVWSMAMFAGAVGALSGVFASFVRITSLNSAISFTVDAHGTRYLLPMLLAWFATVMMLCFREESVSDSKSAPSKAGPVSGEIEFHPENPTQ